MPNDRYYYDQKPYLGPLGKGQNYAGEYFTGHNFEGVWRIADTSARLTRVGVADGDFTQLHTSPLVRQWSPMQKKWVH